ncbi:MAG: tetratricopeptide repeat protein [Acidobacteriota bacterium]|nr:MAG: tetratricopeptide repeat protein [Acidobacteriota bacterium]
MGKDETWIRGPDSGGAPGKQREPDSERRERVGRQFGSYRIQAELSAGGMGVVYRAVDARLHRTVALKFLKQEALEHPQGRERFLIEARAVSQLSHPHIAVVYELDEVDDQLYIAMELLRGGSLTDRIARGPFPVEELVRVGCAVADGLAHAHARRVIHRDIKPDNILFSEDGTPKITDFGLAKLVLPEDESLDSEMPTVQQLTQAGMILGTVSYMAPEQALGRPVDARADLFSLGVVLYQMACGRLPFTGKTVVEAIHALLHDRPVPIRSDRPDFPQPLQAVIMRSIMREPDARFASAAELSAALHQAIAEQGSSSGVTASPAPTVTSERFVGRALELDKLDRLLDDVLEGNARAVALTGEAGAGKSTLAEEFGRRALSRGASIAIGRCLFREGARPYQPILDAVAEHLDSYGITTVDELTKMVAPHGSAPAGLSVIGGMLGLAGASEDVDVAAGGLLDAGAAFMATLTEQGPLVLHIDDLHWADEATLRLLLQMTQRCRKSRLMILLAYRPEEIEEAADASGKAIGETLDRLESSGLFTRIDLSPLQQEDLSVLLEQRYPGRRFRSSFRQRLIEDSSGNPLFINETLRWLEQNNLLPGSRGSEHTAELLDRVALPNRIQSLMERRLEPLDEQQREILEMAAVEGAVFHSATLGAALEMPRIPLLKTLQALEHRYGLIHAVGRDYRFAHAKIRDVLYEKIPPELRIEYHRLVGEYLEQTSADDETKAAAIAFQLEQGGQGARAIPYLLTAGRRAHRLWATEEALRLLRRSEQLASDNTGALDDEQRHAIVWQLAEVEAIVGLFDEATAHYAQARGLAQAVGDAPRACHALVRTAAAHFKQARFDDAIAITSRALQDAGDAGLDREAAAARRILGGVLFAQGQFDEALQELRSAKDVFEQLGEKVESVNCLNRIAHVHWRRGEYETALAEYDRSLILSRDLRNRRLEAYILNAIGCVLETSGQSAAAAERLEEALRIRDEIWDRRGASQSLNNLGYSLERLGRLTESLTYYQRSLEIKRELGDDNGIANTLENITSLHERRGEYEEALSAVLEARTIKERLGVMKERPDYLTSQARLLWKLYRPEEAVPLLEEALQIADDLGLPAEKSTALVVLGQIRQHEGHHDAAVELFESAIETARQANMQHEEFLALYWSIKEELRLDLKRASPEGAERAWPGRLERLRELAAALGGGQYEARLLEIDGQVAAARGDSERAIELLERSARTSTELGLKELTWRVRYELAGLLEKVEGSISGHLSQSAVAAYRDASSVMQEIFAGLHDEKLRHSFQQSPVFQEIVDKARED